MDQLKDPMFGLQEERYQDSNYEKFADIAAVNLPMDRVP